MGRTARHFGDGERQRAPAIGAEDFDGGSMRFEPEARRNRYPDCYRRGGATCEPLSSKRSAPANRDADERDSVKTLVHRDILSPRASTLY